MNDAPKPAAIGLDFEDWAKKRGLSIDRFRLPEVLYTHGITQVAHEAVLASEARIQPVITELKADVERLKDALRKARAFAQAEYEVRLGSYAVDGDISTVSDDDMPVVAEAAECVAAIEAALAPQAAQ